MILIRGCVIMGLRGRLAICLKFLLRSLIGEILLILEVFI